MATTGLASTLTLPVRTYFGITLGMISVSNARQAGHWRSMYSIIVTGALGEPRTFPLCGMPLKSWVTTPASGSFVVVVTGDEDPPVIATTSAIAAATSAIAPTAAPSTFGDALRGPPVLRTGGGVCTCRLRLACFPLVIPLPR